MTPQGAPHRGQYQDECCLLDFFSFLFQYVFR